jgi:molybdopterin-guanine dinucleotide biosynthesis protein A
MNSTTHPLTRGLILAGGRATRMGGRDKALIVLRGEPLLTHVIRHLQPQVDALALSSNAPAANFTAFGLPVLADELTGFQGPLAGIHAGLVHYPQDFVVAVAVDIPLLPADLVARLRAGLGSADCAYASDGAHHALALLLRPGLADVLRAQLERGTRSIKDFLAAHGTAVVFDRPQDRGLFLNLNTPEALAKVEYELASDRG